MGNYKEKKEFLIDVDVLFLPKTLLYSVEKRIGGKKKITLRKELNKKQKKSRRISHVLLKAPTAQHQCNV